MSEFKNLPSGWKVVKLGEIGKIVNGLTYSPENVSNNGLLVLRSSNISDNSIVLNNDDVYVKGISKFNKTLENDILICVRNGSKNLIGKNALITEKYKDLAFGAFMAIFRSNYNLFLIHIFKTNTFFKQVKNDLGATINSINNGNLLNFKIPLPPLDEQKKIAEILSTWDEAINLTINLIESKKQFKKALMQNLLTAKIRFPQFKDEWKFTKLGNLLDYEQPTQYLVSDENYDNGFGTPVLTAGKTFILGYTNETKGIFQDNLPVIIFDDFTTATQFVNFPFKVKSSAMKILKQKNTMVNIRLVYEMMQMINFVASDHKRYWISEFQDLEIKLPNLNEQQKIAEVLMACDDEINLLNLKLENLKKQKQGLMQKLLSGKVRVKYV
jgi:restriction modification system DNA specificity domain protein